MQEANQEAENKAVRKAAWGDDGSSGEGDDKMEQIIFGDFNNPSPATPDPPVPTNSTLKTLGLLTIGGLLGGGGLAAGAAATYFLNKPSDVVETLPAAAQERVEIGLGRIEDYLSKDEGSPND